MTINLLPSLEAYLTQRRDSLDKQRSVLDPNDIIGRSLNKAQRIEVDGALELCAALNKNADAIGDLANNLQRTHYKLETGTKPATSSVPSNEPPTT